MSGSKQKGSDFKSSRVIENSEDIAIESESDMGSNLLQSFMGGVGTVTLTNDYLPEIFEEMNDY